MIFGLEQDENKKYFLFAGHFIKLPALPTKNRLIRIRKVSDFQAEKH